MKNIFARDPKLKYKKKCVPYYASKIGQLNIYKKKTIRKYRWNYDIIVPWRFKFLKPTKDWLDLEIARDKIFIHPLSLKTKYIIFTLKKTWKKLPEKIDRQHWLDDRNHFINSLHNTTSSIKYIHPTVAKKLKFKKKDSPKIKIIKDFPFHHILLHYIPKFNQLEKTAITKILTRYHFNQLGYPYFLYWKLINIYNYQYGVFKYVKIHPEWKISYAPHNNIFKETKLSYFNHYFPIWENIKRTHINKDYEILNHKPNVKPRTKKSHLKFPNEFYLGKSFYGTYKEIDSMINLLKAYPEYTGKVLKNIKNSNCLEYVKKDYYKHIFSNIKPMYCSLWYHYALYLVAQLVRAKSC